MSVVMYKSHGNTKQKSIVNTEKVEGREKKRTTKESYQTTKKEQLQKHPESTNKVTVSTWLSIIILNENGLNLPIKRHRVAKCIRKSRLLIYRLPEQTHFRCKDTQTESEGVEKIFHTNGNQQKTGVALLMSDKIDFKTKTQ